MDQIWPLMTAILGANLLTIAFVWSLYRAWQWRHDENQIEAPVYLGLILPPLVMAGGFWLYG